MIANKRRTALSVAVLAPLAVLGVRPAQAADVYPQRALRMIVPFPPGGATDTIARLVGARLASTFGQPVVLDNRPGGGTVTATDIAAKAAPDGYTMLVVTAAFTANPSLLARLPYDSERDFAPVSLMSSSPNLLLVTPSLPVQSVRDLIAYAKQNPGKLSFGSAGNGTSNHLAGEMLRTQAAIDIVHVPYKGDPPSITDLITGQIQILFIGLAPVAQHIKAGRLRAIGVAAQKPSAQLTSAAPLSASGLPGFESAVWNGMVTRSNAPAAVIQRLHAEIASALANPETRDQVIGLGFDPIGSSPTEFRDFLRAETARVSKTVKAAGIRID
ncbi:MAG: tripartite tricarboxylate transporter substrate binding protein [Rhodocyclaceae bacterium]|nr:tripartite tricarboxylate transporter substrate binding protein [Rhodocyclaceae bacterium]MCA3074733.1 tripartite tricarboxylate transporter substrate binding protein [Rhodocyclaceae bacterium]MCA3091641.1 tripartite tricarboxylate transporter substrate binding protein [Rhodocyclaceae bacterium]MCA3093993.1 tripartite tricarboxylate transporter substrate binding protein [Rhodocyclaceae bacterium]MCA3099216.1 tripartite tricarboxylate transporter substrate binding protein [Rhodocyclaceae bact